MQFKDGVVGESVGSVPAVEDCSLFVLPVGQLLSPEAVVLDVVDGLEVEDGSAGNERVDHEGLKSKNEVYSCCKDDGVENALNCFILEKSFSFLSLVMVDCLPRISDTSDGE